MFKDFETIKDYLFNKLPYFSKTTYSLENFKLQKTLDFLNHLNIQKQKFDIIHVAGTNGKGSVSNMLASILIEHNYKVGVYTSPHLFDLKERIKINGLLIDEDYIINFINKNYNFINQLNPSFFEIMFVLALDYFKFKNIDIAIIEVGMGGRLDSTNVITPIISVITNISFDHTQWLGNTLEEIATEKAGIIKPNVPIVIGEFNTKTSKIFNEIANKNLSKIVFSNDHYEIIKQELKKQNNIFLKHKQSNEILEFNLDLLGNYQAYNLITVLSVVEILKEKNYLIDDKKVKNSLKNITTKSNFFGRWSIIKEKPLTIIDVAHNEAGLQNIVNYINKNNFNNVHIILGMVKDKDHSKSLSILPYFAKYYFTQSNMFRVLDSEQLKQKALLYNLKGDAYLNVNDAINVALQNAKFNDVIIICGSFFIISDVDLSNFKSI